MQTLVIRKEVVGGCLSKVERAVSKAVRTRSASGHVTARLSRVSAALLPFIYTGLDALFTCSKKTSISHECPFPLVDAASARQSHGVRTLLPPTEVQA